MALRFRADGGFPPKDLGAVEVWPEDSLGTFSVLAQGCLTKGKSVWDAAGRHTIEHRGRA